ncbi:MAG: DnaJ domain-containing protein [Desulfotomaculaceae bacterium]|nr:DnaJ domain-containing protein [Desulfotomaculaceae bacterium]
MEDYYSILGISRKATRKQINRAYRALARKYHPDVNKDDMQAEEKMKKINAAYEVLVDYDKRAQYDRKGLAGFPTTNSRWSNPVEDDFDPGLYYMQMMMMWQRKYS